MASEQVNRRTGGPKKSWWRFISERGAEGERETQRAAKQRAAQAIRAFRLFGCECRLHKERSLHLLGKPLFGSGWYIRT